MNNEWAFLPMRGSNELLGDPDALSDRLQEDSYLLFRGILDPADLEALRLDVLGVLAGHGWVVGGDFLPDAIATGPAWHEDQEEYMRAYCDVQRLESFHTLAHDERLVGLLRQVVGPTAFPHPLKIARIGFPGDYEVSTPPHQDFPNNQGTPDLLASWIPLADCPRELGALAVLRGSHRYGMLPLALHPGAGKRQAEVPVEMLEQLHWVTTDFEAGDVLLFPSLTVHAALHNVTEFNLRLSVDFRWQQEGAALTEGCLLPHFQRIGWEEIYAGWSSDRWQYYWRDLDYEVVPFETFPVLGLEHDPGAIEGGVAFLDALREQVESGQVELSEDYWREVLTIEARTNRRLERREQRVAERIGDGGLQADL
jgi:hypothetical protein